MSSTQALSKILNDLHTFSTFHPERACSILHNRSYHLPTHEQAPVEGRGGCTGQMGHKLVKRQVKMIISIQTHRRNLGGHMK